ncbi:MAG: carbohydrate ABC transporter permease [Oscillospiraceae bacterium]|nr:carbohydrate ABC transporter permease [Oscillospiraceae bacterium]
MSSSELLSAKKMSPGSLLTKKLRLGLFELFMIAFALLYLFPFYTVITLALKSPAQALMNPLAIPRSIEINNFITAWQQTNFPRALGNSLFITGFSVSMVLAVTGMGTFAISRMNKNISNAVYYFCIAGLMVPFYLALSPTVKLMKDLSLMNSILGISLFYVGRGVAFAVFLFMGFIRTIPEEIAESAFMDGCRPLRMYWSIYFPMLKPVVSTLAILNSLSIWNDFLLPLLVLQSSRNYTLTLAQYIFRGEATTRWHLVFAAYLMAMTPLILFYFALQKNIVEGIATGAIKG